MINSKADLRKSVKRILKGISREALHNKSEELSANLLKFIKSKNFKEGFLLGGFAPLRDEAKWFLKLYEYRNQFAFPGPEPDSRDSKKMSFYQSCYEDLEERNDFGVPILVPKSNAEKVTPSVLVIPGLAFSKKGERLGRGKGFYDLYLKNFIGVRVGVCFKEQLLEYIPVNGEDQYVDYIVTDHEIISVD